jgi:hypothetical protein
MLGWLFVAGFTWRQQLERQEESGLLVLARRQAGSRR